MHSRPIWEGSISFGLVQIPVGLHSAESRDDLDFDLLDRRDMAPVGYQKFNRSTNEPVEQADIVKGYEYAPGEYVTVEKDDFKRANVKATQTVDIVQFTDASDIDVMYFEKPYYLVPGKRGEKAYVLLREVLKRSGKVGIARVVIRTRESVAALMVRGPALVLELLRYDHELRKPEELELPTATAGQLKVSPAELKMAERLVSDMDAPFKPAAFKDTYRDDLLEFITHKVESGETETPEPPADEPEPSNVVDIMALLRRSLAGKHGHHDDTDDTDDAANAPPRRKTAASKKAAKNKTAAKAVAPRKVAAKTTTRTASSKKSASKKAVSKKTATRKSGRPTSPRALPAARRAS
jgi:DNA end-binding protein Ku